MAEPVGGKVRWWKSPELLKAIDFTASIFGLFALILIPGVVVIHAAEKLVNVPVFKDFTDWKKFWHPLLVWVFFLALLGFFTFWFLVVFRTAIKLLPVLLSRMFKKQPDANGEVPLGQAATEGVGVNNEMTFKEKVAPTPNPTSTSQAETHKQAEQELRVKIENARKSFKEKAMAFRASVPSTFDLNIADGVVQFSEKFKVTSLKVEMKEGSLRSYLTWDHEAMTLKVNDPIAFIKDRSVRFALQITDLDAAADQDLKDEIKPEILEVIVVAKYPSIAQRFLDWKSKSPTAFRLENAKQGQDVDYDIKSLLGYDSDWVIWVSAEGCGMLKADLEAHRLKGEPSIGTDTKMHVVFACPGCESLRHELDLLLTCNMDAEQRWKQIEKEDSDKEAVLSDEEKLKLAKMADAVRSTANAYEVRKPDDVFSKPHRVSRRQQIPDFDLAYASIRGRSHIRSGSFREDDVEARFFLEGKAVAIVVSDGAGSAPLSRRGSDVVTSVGITRLIELGELLVKSPVALTERSSVALEGFAAAVLAIRAQIEFEAENIKEQRPDFLAKEMYATFLAALILPAESGHVLLSYSVGDGAIGLGLAGDTSGIKCSPDHGQSAGQTLFVLNKGAEDAEKRLVFTQLPASYALLLMSDGVSDPRFQDGDDAKPQVWDQLAGELKDRILSEPLSPEAERSESFAERGPLCEWLDSYEKGHHDDRTIAVLLHKIS